MICYKSFYRHNNYCFIFSVSQWCHDLLSSRDKIIGLTINEEYWLIPLCYRGCNLFLVQELQNTIRGYLSIKSSSYTICFCLIYKYPCLTLISIYLILTSGNYNKKLELMLTQYTGQTLKISLLYFAFRTSLLKHPNDVICKFQ